MWQQHIMVAVGIGMLVEAYHLFASVTAGKLNDAAAAVELCYGQ